MHRLPINEKITGEVLAKSVFNEEGKLLLQAGTKISKNHLQVLHEANISEVYVEDDNYCLISLPDSYYKYTYNHAKQILEKRIDCRYLMPSASNPKVRDTIYRLMEEILCDKGIISILASMKWVDDYTFEHSIHVCMLSLIMGIGVGYNIRRLKDLGIGAILHDIGKLRIPENILKKPAKLTDEEFEEIKKHTIYGYGILKQNKNISMISAFIAIGHHERYDGSGYPMHLKHENIHECARIVAVADVFDALTTDRVYRKKMKLNEAIEYITDFSSNYFDRKIVNAFVSYLPLYQVGTGVILNTGERGLVANANKDMPTRPVVKIMYNKNGKRLKKNYKIDLTKKSNVLIEGVCDL